MPGQSTGDTLSYVASQLDRFEVLAHRLMSYARRSEMVTEPVNLHDLVLDVLELLDTQAKAHGIGLKTEFNTDDPWVDGDAGRLEHMLVNLVLNAIQANKPGGSVLVLTAESELGPRLEVIDDGPGMTDELTKRIFEPFVSTRADGFGLGLYSCQEIALSHRASLSCRSLVGKGTTFSIQFEVAR